MYYVYILLCADNTYYTGIAKDVRVRTAEHNDSKKGARYTRSRRPVVLVYSRRCRNRSYAQKEEARIKQLSHAEKLQLMHTATHASSKTQGRKIY